MPRRRRRGAGYPSYAGSVGTGGAGPDTVGGFESQPDLGGFGPEGAGGGGMPAINIYNTAIAQAAAEQGPGGITQGASTGGGKGKKGHKKGGKKGPKRR